MLTRLILAALGVLVAFSPHAQPSANKIQQVVDRSRPSVVRVIATGRNPSGQTTSIEGSGFFVCSQPGISMLVTASHVLGSSETEQNRNRDWLVEGGIVDRKIQLFAPDAQGGLIERNGEVFVGPTALHGVDLALLMIKQGPFPTLQLAETLFDRMRIKDVVLLGYPFGTSEMRRPPAVGRGSLHSPTSYKTNTGARRGESGGPWIDLETERVLAVASRTATGDTIEFEATPVSLLRPQLAVYCDADTPPPPFRITNVAGAAVVHVSGETGQLRAMAPTRTELGQSADVRAQGAEASQCDAGSGRTLSRAAARAQVSRADANGVRFEYALEAQGGHYRSVAACIQGMPVGLTGHDTTATAQAQISANVMFEKGTSAKVALVWEKFPANAGRYEVRSREGAVLAWGSIDQSGRALLAGLGAGTYTLQLETAARVESRGGCCQQTSIVNATVNLIGVETP